MSVVGSGDSLLRVFARECFSISGDAGMGEDLVFRVEGLEVVSSPVKVMYGIQGNGIWSEKIVPRKVGFALGKGMLSDRVEGKYLTPNVSMGDYLVRHYGIQIVLEGVSYESVKRSQYKKLLLAGDAVGVSLMRGGIEGFLNSDSDFLSGYVVSGKDDILGVGKNSYEVALRVFGLVYSPNGDNVASLSERLICDSLDDFRITLKTVLGKVGYKNFEEAKGSKSYDGTITEELIKCSEIGLWRKG